MPVNMTHKEWMKLTYGGKTSIRSSKLKTVDSALEHYQSSKSPNDLKKLQTALIGWMTSKGNNWKSSIRNKNNAVESLYRQVAGIAMSAPIDAAAMSELQQQPAQIIHTLFKDASISWKNEFRGKLNSNLVKPFDSDFALRLAMKQYKTSASNNKFGLSGNTASAAHNINTLSKKSSGSGQVGNAITKCISQIVPSDAQVEVLTVVKTLVPTFEAEFAAAIMPIAGLVTSAGTTLWNTGNAINKQIGIRNANMHRERSLAGIESSHAIKAMIRILERERNADIYSAGVSFTEFGGKLAGLAVDGGVTTNTAIGLAANIAKLMNIVRIVYRDIQEKNAANKIMASDDLDLRIFETSPLVGCYLICCAPTSVLMSLIYDEFGQAGWMDKVERGNDRHLQPLRQKALDVIKHHRFEIRSLARFPGMLETNKDELKRMQENIGKTGMVGISSDSVLHV